MSLLFFFLMTAMCHFAVGSTTSVKPQQLTLPSNSSTTLVSRLVKGKADSELNVSHSNNNITFKENNTKEDDLKNNKEGTEGESLANENKHKSSSDYVKEGISESSNVTSNINTIAKVSNDKTPDNDSKENNKKEDDLKNNTEGTEGESLANENKHKSSSDYVKEGISESSNVTSNINTIAKVSNDSNIDKTPDNDSKVANNNNSTDNFTSKVDNVNRTANNTSESNMDQNDNHPSTLKYTTKELINSYPPSMKYETRKPTHSHGHDPIINSSTGKPDSNFLSVQHTSIESSGTFPPTLKNIPKPVGKYHLLQTSALDHTSSSSTDSSSSKQLTANTSGDSSLVTLQNKTNTTEETSKSELQTVRTSLHGEEINNLTRTGGFNDEDVNPQKDSEEPKDTRVYFMISFIVIYFIFAVGLFVFLARCVYKHTTPAGRAMLVAETIQSTLAGAGGLIGGKDNKNTPQGTARKPRRTRRR